MTIEIRELVIEARVTGDADVAESDRSTVQPLTIAQEERLVRQITRRVLAQLHEELRGNGEDHRW